MGCRQFKNIYLSFTENLERSEKSSRHKRDESPSSGPTGSSNGGAGNDELSIEETK